jgi:hypothetical protein
LSEIRKAVLRFTRRSIGQALLAALTLGVLPQAVEAFRPHLFGGGAVGGGGGSLGTLTLVNDSASVATAIGTPTRTFGWVFSPGAVPSGTAPIFTVGGVVQPFSANIATARVIWPDGSLRFCAFSLVPTLSVPASSSQAVTINSGGTWPSASSRTTAEVTAQNITINAPKGSVGSESTDLGAWLTSANSARLVKTRQWMDGAAGAVWSFSIDMSATNGGSRYGQLCTTVYIHSLNNASGGLGGFRWMGDIRQPYFDDTSIAKNTRWFAPPNSGTPSAGLNISVAGSGVFAPPNWPHPSTGYPFTVTSTDVSNSWAGETNTPNVLFYGATDANVTPCLLTATANYNGINGGASPPSNQFCWVAQGVGYIGGSSTTSTFTAGSVANFGNYTNYYAKATGTGTIVPLPAIQPFGRLALTDQYGEYMFFQGSGSITVDTPLRPGVPDPVAWSRSGCMPPYDTTLASVVTDTTFNNTYNPFSQGTINGLTTQQAGNGPYIGPFPSDFLTFYYLGSVNSYRNIVMMTLAAGLNIFDFTSTSAPDIPLNLGPNTYTGMVGAPTVYWGGRSVYQNIPGLSGGDTGVDSWLNELDHQPNLLGGYLITGRLDMFDRMCGYGNEVMSHYFQGGPNRDLTIGGTAYWGLWYSLGAEYRGLGWPCRSMGMTACFAPNPASGTDFAGAQIGQYFRDMTDQNGQVIMACLNPANSAYGSATSYIATTRNIWTPTDGATYMLGDGPEWEFSYCMPAMLWGATAGITSCQNVVQKTGPRWAYWGTNLGGFFNIYHYYSRIADTPPSGVPAQHVAAITSAITSDAQQCVSGTNTWVNAGVVITWSASGSPYFAMGGGFGDDYTPANGDQLMWASVYDNDATSNVPGGLTYGVQYYIRDLVFLGGSSYTFNLAATPTGAAIAATNTGSTSGCWWWRNNQNQTTDGAGFWDGINGYVTGIYAMSCWHNAYINKFITPGYTTFAPIFADATFRNETVNGGSGVWYATGGGNPGSPTQMTWAMQQTYHA